MTKKTKRIMVHVYKNYALDRDGQDPVVEEWRTIQRESGLTLKQIRDISGVAVSTMKAWLTKKTKKPQNPTMEAAGRACGMKRVWVKVK